MQPTPLYSNSLLAMPRKTTTERYQADEDDYDDDSSQVKPLNALEKPVKKLANKSESTIEHLTLAESATISPVEQKKSALGWLVLGGVGVAGLASLVIWHKPIQQWFTKTFHTLPEPIKVAETPIVTRATITPALKKPPTPEEVRAGIQANHEALMEQVETNAALPLLNELSLIQAGGDVIETVGAKQFTTLPTKTQALLISNMKAVFTKQLETIPAFNTPLLGETIADRAVRKMMYVEALTSEAIIQTALKTIQPNPHLGNSKQVRLVDLAQLVYEQERKMTYKKEVKTATKSMAIQATKTAKNHQEITEPAQRKRALTAALVYADVLNSPQSYTFTDAQQQAYSQVQAFAAGQEIHLPDQLIPNSGTATLEAKNTRQVNLFQLKLIQLMLSKFNP